jgi:hypothetical protein
MDWSTEQDEIMNVYHGCVDERGSWGYYLYIDIVIVANTEAEALGLALESNSDTNASQWKIEQLDLSKPGTYHISRGES